MPQEIIRNVRIENLSSPIVTAQILNSGAYGTDHSSLINLSVDDHPQYFNIERGDLRYLKLSEYSNDHSSLINLNADDHPQYFNIERGDLRYLKLSDFIQGHVIENEGIPLIQRANLNFVGGGVTVTDNGNDTSIVTIPDASIDKLCQINDVYCYTGSSDSDSSAPLGTLPECIPADGSILIYDCEAENPGWYPSPQQQLPTVLFTDVDGEGTLRYVTPTPNSPNTIDAGVTNSYILSGRQNTINSGILNIIISGSQNKIFGGNQSVISGGSHNKIHNGEGFIGGGQENRIRGSYGFIAGGYNNEIGSGTTGSSILGGWRSYIGGDYSVASGKNASTATFDGTFAFADSTTNVGTIIPNANDQFAIKAAGGLRLIDGQQGANKVLTSDANGVGHWADPTGSSSLNAVGAGSTTSSDSTYTLTNNVDVKFNSSEGNPIFKLDESTESILIGADSHPFTGQRDNKLYIEGDGNTTQTRTHFAVKNTGPASAASFDMVCNDGGAISIQASGTGYNGGHKAWVYSYEGLPLFLASDGDMQSGGFSDISFSPGGWNNTSVWFKPSGNVGIGTSSPSTALHIEKDMGPSGGEGIYLRNTNANGFSEVVFDNNATTNNGSFVFGYGGTNTGSPNHAYFWNRKSAPIKFGTNNLERLRINADGKVGIGTDTPNSKINALDGTVAELKFNSGLSDLSPTLAVGNTGGSGKFAALAAGTNGSAFFYDQSGQFTINSAPKSDYTNNIIGSGTTRFIINNSGNVGIGTSDPTATLHVDSDDNEAVRLYCANSTGVTAAGIRIMNKTGGAGDFASLSFGAGTTTNTRARMGAKFGADGISGSYVFQTRTLAGNLDEKMVISSEGEVGIGTLTPSAKLEVAGQIKITGGNPQANYVLTSDATGLASWQSAGTGGGPIAINDLTDVDTSTSAPNNGESLVWNSTTSKWEPSLITGGTGSVGTLQTVTNNGNTTTNPIEFNIGGAGQEFIKINATASSGRPLTFYDNGSFVGGIDYNFAGDYWSFDVSDSNGGRVTDAFTIQSETDDNFIGFGTTTPDAKLHINATAINGRETLLKGSVSDAGDDAFYLGNGTTANGSFMPRFAGYVNSSGTGYSQSFWGMTNIANDASDSSSFGLTHFSAMRSSGLPSDPTNGTLSEIENRKLFTFGGFGPNIYMTMAAGGNLGLGTGTPDAPLHINASAINGRENLIKGSVSDGGNDAFYLGNGTSTANSFVPRFAGYVDSFNSKPSSQFWGLTNSANDTSDSSSTGLINFAAGISSNATDPTNGTLTPVLNRKLFTFSDISGGTNHMTIAAGGNIGFGTNTPDSKVDVNGRMRFQATTAPAPTSGKGFEAFYSTGSDKSFFLSIDRDPSTDLLKAIDMRASSLEFWTGSNLNNDAIRLKVEDDGVEFLESVRILNTSAGAPAFRCLDSANANFRIQSSLRNGSQNTSFNIDAVGQPGDANRETLVVGYFHTPGRYKIASNKGGTGDLHPIHFEMEWDNPVMVIETDGKVGIGTTTPDKGLNITGSGTHSTLKITDDGTGSAAAEMYIGSNDGWSFFNERSTKNFNFRETITSGSLINADRLTIQQGGNIGIGTTTPTAKLEVAGQVKITGGNPGTGKVLTSDAGGTASWQEPTGGTGGGDPVAAPTSETSLYIDAGGLLGTDGGASASTGGDAGTNNSIDWWNVDTNEELFCKVAMSPQWDGGDIDVEFFWTATGASAGDNVRWAAAATGGSNGDVWDAAFSTVTETDDDLLIANGDVHVVKASGITPAGTTDDGSILFLKLKRTPTVGQTASVDARLLGVRVHYKNLVHRSWYVNKMGAENAEADTTVLEKTAFVAADAGIIYGVHSGVSTAPSSAGLSVDVKINGVSILSTLGVIGAAQNSSESTSSTPHVLATDPTTFSKGDRISFEISSFGGTGGNGLHTDLLISWAQ